MFYEEEEPKKTLARIEWPAWGSSWVTLKFKSRMLLLYYHAY